MRKAIAALLLALVTAAAPAQDDDTVSADDIVKALSVGSESRAIVVGRKRTVEGLSIDLKIEFGFDSSTLSETATAQLDALLGALADPALADYGFSIIGHTDAKGDDDYNLRLSRERAWSVVDYLTTGGLARERLRPDGKGERELLYPHKPDDPSNRRVEIINRGAVKAANDG